MNVYSVGVQEHSGPKRGGGLGMGSSDEMDMEWLNEWLNDKEWLMDIDEAMSAAMTVAMSAMCPARPSLTPRP
jgi:hypothetical protein